MWNSRKIQLFNRKSVETKIDEIFFYWFHLKFQVDIESILMYITLIMCIHCSVSQSKPKSLEYFIL